MKSSLPRSTFERIYSDGKRVSGALCRILVLPGEGRFGFATPSKLGNTPRRNRLKRRFREAVRMHGTMHDPRFDCIVSANLAADAATFESICREIAELLPKAYARWEEN